MTTHAIKVHLTIHTAARTMDEEAYREAVAAAIPLLQESETIRAGAVVGRGDNELHRVLVEFETPMVVVARSPSDAAGKLVKHEMRPHQQRVIEEYEQLAERLRKLGKFITDTPAVFLALPLEEQDLLHQQHAAMTQYHDILVQRIAGFAGS